MLKLETPVKKTAKNNDLVLEGMVLLGVVVFSGFVLLYFSV